VKSSLSSSFVLFARLLAGGTIRVRTFGSLRGNLFSSVREVRGKFFTNPA
jgi:hypothetical protein